MRAPPLLSHLVGMTDGLSIDQEVELHHLIHEMQLSDRALDISTTTVVTFSLDHISRQTLCFPYEIVNYELVVKPFEIIDCIVPCDQYQD